jgi:diaminopimelate decarboxylase
LGRNIELVIEPGRAAIAGCATLLTKVVSVKWQSEKQIIGVDTTVANLSVPAVHGRANAPYLLIKTKRDFKMT